MTDHAVGQGSESGSATSVLVRAAKRQVDAWEKLVSLFGPLVYGWCRRWGLQPADAENVGQEVFLRVAEGLAEFRGDRPGDSFRGWLYRITRHCFVDHFRKREAVGRGGAEAERRLEQVAAEASDGEDNPELASQDDALLYRRLVEFIRGEFSDRDWNAFYRVVIDGIAPAEAAGELKVSVNVVYLARSRVLKRVREEFDGLIPDDS